MNQIFSERRVFTYKDTAVVVPNSDTPYSFACLDLRAELYVVSVPAVEKERYYSVQFVDWNTFNVGYVGSRAMGNEAGDWLLSAAAAKAGIYGNSADGALYPMSRWTADGETLDSSKHNYTLMRLYWPKTEAPSILPRMRVRGSRRGWCG